MRNVIKGKNVQKQLYFKEALDAAITCTNLVQIVTQHNPNLEHLAVAVLLTLFPAAFFLLCCTKLGIAKAEENYKLLSDGIKIFSKAFQKLGQFHSILLLLESKDLVEAKEYEEQLNNIEERIKHMEQSLIKPNNRFLQMRDKVRPDVRLVVLPETLEKELFQQNHEHLLYLRFKRFPTAIYVMSSDEWYTAIATGLDIDSYHAILHQIQLKAFRHFDMELSGEDYTASYYAGAIHASLNDWIDQFHPFLQSAMTAIRNSAHVENTWFSLYIALIYYSIRVKLILPNLMRNVIRGKDVRNILYFSDAYDAAITGSILVNMVQKYNPNLDFFATAALLTLFPTGFFLLCCSKLGITECESSYKDTMEGIKYFSRAFQKMNQFYSVLQLLESKDLVETVIYYGIFVTRQSSEFFERPSTRNY
ncbi:hypothetical protein HDV04_000773 [Boothiomyces sp. JEL0838]|nr:hypothetical protein HDV04_000773 [Boothiomyces sp. JEL0838]